MERYLYHLYQFFLEIKLVEQLFILYTVNSFGEDTLWNISFRLFHEMCISRLFHCVNHREMFMVYFLRHFMKYKNSENRFSKFSLSWKTLLLNLFPCLINPFVINGVYKSLKENVSITWKASKVVFVFWEAVVQRCHS